MAVERGLTPEQAQAVAISLFYQELAIPPMDGLRVVGIRCRGDGGRDALVVRGEAGVDEFFSWQADPAAYGLSGLRSVLDRAPEVDRPEPTS